MKVISHTTKDCSISINHLQILVLNLLDHFMSNYQRPQIKNRKGEEIWSHLHIYDHTCCAFRDTIWFVNWLFHIIPQMIYSTTATNFIGAEWELKEILNRIDQNCITNFLSQNSIDWNFNPPSSPWMSGTWEALIKSVKRPLKVVIQDCLFTNKMLATLIYEVELTPN